MIAWILAATLAPPPAPAPAPAPESESESESDSVTDSDSDSDSDSNSDSDRDPAIQWKYSDPPAPEQSPPSGRVGAVGGKGQSPLPPPPSRVDPRTIDDQPWRGRGFFEIRLDAIFPIGGRKPAGGNVISALGGVTLGWRASQVFALSTGASTFIHDAVTRTVLDEYGEEVDVRSFGRITVFDIMNVRAYVPLKGKVQPYAEVGAGVGWYAGPKASNRPAVGTARGALGLDIWLGPTFTLGFGAEYRLLAIRDSVGHRLQTGLRAGVHW